MHSQRCYGAFRYARNKKGERPLYLTRRTSTARRAGRASSGLSQLCPSDFCRRLHLQMNALGELRVAMSMEGTAFDRE
jgi:hypothetical protein